MSKLRGIELFQNLAPEELQSIEDLAVSCCYPKNKLMIKENETANAMYFIDNGKVRVFVTDETGKQLTLDTLGTGEYFGELSLLDEASRSASVITLERSEMSMINKNDFTTILTRQPKIASVLLKNLAAQVRLLTDKIKIIALQDVYGRIRLTLTNLAEEEAETLVIPEKITQQDLANRIGSSREMVARVMKDLQTGGYIAIEKKQIRILKALPKNY